MTKKELIFKHRNLVSLGCRLHNLPSRLFRMRVKGKNNRIEAPCALLKQVSIHIVGDNNQVIFEDFSQIKKTKITIFGNNNVVHFGKRTYLFDVEFFLEIYQVSIDPDEHFWKTQVAALPWVNVHDNDNLDSQYLRRYNVGSIPTFFLIDRSNSLYKRDAQIKDLDKEIESLL